MAYFAQLDDDGIVVQVISISNDICPDPAPENEQVGIDFIANTLKLSGTWKQTSYNANFRSNYAGIGYTYDAARDAFIAPQPLPSWVLNESTCRWEAPVPYPTDGGQYWWNEDMTSWVAASAG